MRRHRFISLMLSCLVAMPFAAQAAETTWTEGTNYVLITPAQPTSVAPGKVEVTELFSYACPYCYRFMATARQLQQNLPANAQMVYVPASFIPTEDWPMFQRAYITAQLLGIADKTHDAIFNAVWKSGELATMDPSTNGLKAQMPTIEDAARVYSKLTGVSTDKFLETARSFAVGVKMNADDELVKSYQIDGTPSLVINGKYRVLLDSVPKPEQLISLVKFLVAKESHAASK